MTNDEIRMSKQFQNLKHEGSAPPRQCRRVGFRASSFFRHSSFVIRYSTARLVPVVLLLIASSVAKSVTTTETPGRPLNLEFQPLPVAEKETPPVLRLRGKDARQQLLVTAKFDSGVVRDYTRRVSYSVLPPDVVRIDKAGRVTPLDNGTATVTAKDEDGLTATLAIAVERFEEIEPINFANQIVPIFTKAGCNAGGCHGKASGQNGFKLSLLGFEPSEDYEHLIKEARGRRSFPAAPERSLLLLKATGELPHGGCKRLEKGSRAY